MNLRLAPGLGSSSNQTQREEKYAISKHEIELEVFIGQELETRVPSTLETSIKSGIWGVRLLEEVIDRVGSRCYVPRAEIENRQHIQIDSHDPGQRQAHQREHSQHLKCVDEAPAQHTRHTTDT